VDSQLLISYILSSKMKSLTFSLCIWWSPLYCNSRYQNKFMFDMYCIYDKRNYHDSILISQLMKKKNAEDFIEEIMILWQKIFLLVYYSHPKVYVLIINPESSIDWIVNRRQLWFCYLSCSTVVLSWFELFKEVKLWPRGLFGLISGLVFKILPKADGYKILQFFLYNFIT